MKSLTFICFVFGTFCFAESFTAEEQEAHKKCGEAFNCLSCMSAHRLCGWCTQTEWKIQRTNRKRCDLRSELEVAGCKDIQFMNTTWQVLEDRDLRDDVSTRGASGQAIQIRPQLLEVALRPGETFEFDFTFRRAFHYPIYVYFLMDLSKTMYDDKQTLVSLGRDLVSNLSSISENFGVAFGSFVDKVVVPFVPHEMEWREQCGDTYCDAPYDFRHQLKFTNNNADFIRAISDARISSNLDAPEGQLDALMQVLVCGERIGWQANSRKMILLLTDSVYHFAGDGLLAGIVRPHDGQCHLNATGYYSAEGELDYPSIGHIAVVARERKVNIIFAVSSGVDQAYQQLPELIPGSFVDILSNDSSNIMQLLRNSYNNVSELVELVEEHKPAGVEVDILTICNWTAANPPTDADFTRVSKCDGVQPGQQIRYRVRVTVKDCSLLNRKTFNLSLSPIGLADNITLTIATQCACDCEKPAYRVPNSPVCSGRGALVCGRCENCQSPYVGATCSCDERLDNSARCRATNTSVMCTGRGYCDCGECMCSAHPQVKDRTYSGTYCECDDYACPYASDNGQLCGGPERGTCKCGLCTCNPRYDYADCSCDRGQSNCNASNGQLCNGRGVCECNKCRCTDPQWTGVRCEDCLQCDLMCTENRDCALCVGFKRGPRLLPAAAGEQPRCDPSCDHVKVVDELAHAERQCTFPFEDEAGCYYLFGVSRNASMYVVSVKRTKDCAREADIVAIVGGVGGAILLVGLLLVAIWKIYVTINDRREYARFLKANETARTHVVTNPLYEKPEVTVANPMYTGQFKL